MTFRWMSFGREFEMESIAVGKLREALSGLDDSASVYFNCGGVVYPIWVADADDETGDVFLSDGQEEKE